jgi:hypothetical protein
MIDLTVPGHLAPVSADVEARSGPKFALEPQQRADCDENKLRLLRAPGESYSDVILRLRATPSPREARCGSRPRPLRRMSEANDEPPAALERRRNGPGP